MKSKYFLLIAYLGILWLVGIFVFGDSGILDNIYKTKEIEQLNKVLYESQLEIQEMTKEYYHLADMKMPDRAFLIDQGRKIEDVIIFKADSSTNEQITTLFIDEKYYFLHGAIIALFILILGCTSIFIISYISKKKKNI